jgi:hypothetical protein
MPEPLTMKIKSAYLLKTAILFVCVRVCVYVYVYIMCVCLVYYEDQVCIFAENSNPVCVYACVCVCMYS